MDRFVYVVVNDDRQAEALQLLLDKLPEAIRTDREVSSTAGPYQTACRPKRCRMAWYASRTICAGA